MHTTDEYTLMNSAARLHSMIFAPAATGAAWSKRDATPYGVSGNGTGPHRAGGLFKLTAGVKLD